MHSLTFASGHANNWKVLYRAAIHEPDRTQIPQRISEAEQAVIARGRELFHSPEKTEEREELEDALYAFVRSAVLQDTLKKPRRNTNPSHSAQVSNTWAFLFSQLVVVFE